VPTSIAGQSAIGPELVGLVGLDGRAGTIVVSTVLLIAVAVLVGSLPTGLLVARRAIGTDIRQEGSGNIGAANVARTAGMKVGALVAVLDILKGVVPVLLALWASLDHTAVALVAVAAVLGHDFSLFLSFKGGKGVATTLGVAIVLAPLAALAAIVSWIIIMAIWRYSSVASLTALLIAPAVSALTGSPSAYTLALVALCLIGLAKHWENIVRLAQGRENKFRQRPASGA
jgi:glycerol-3-phosphate acyltransferase PlsY